QPTTSPIVPRAQRLGPRLRPPRPRVARRGPRADGRRSEVEGRRSKVEGSIGSAGEVPWTSRPVTSRPLTSVPCLLTSVSPAGDLADVREGVRRDDGGELDVRRLAEEGAQPPPHLRRVGDEVG